MRDSFSTLFYIQGSRLDKNGMSLIYLRVTVNGKRSEMSLQRKGNGQKTLLSIYGDHNEELSELVGREFSSGAYQRHLRTAKHLKAFIKKEYGHGDISVKKVDLKFINRFEHFLKTTLKDCGQNTVTKYVTNLKMIMRICYANDWAGFKELNGSVLQIMHQ
ncbi:phage integrase SAM-like domain and Arm DNA-binding domain-containing protein [Flagellimonas sp.]|uniref:phage integrase SAM-like domain and Arm DNA-binding domain-containing protein n=1 Tax=Flagellimonas sp. TaxID=2058762 RepID=UPI003B50C034